MTIETHSFQTEVQQLLQLMIHSLYSNKEIFLRELISNSSDALDKARFEEMTNKDMLKSEKDLSVTISLQSESRKLVIEDNGIGMNKEEIIHNLGTIASSGTKKFLESLSDKDKKDSNLIGQFGVGFYSAFMVAESIQVESLSARGGEPVIWSSTGDGKYNLGPGTRKDRGTRIEITLKEEDKEYLDEWKLRSLIKKYSNYVTYPINLVDKENKEERVNSLTPVWAKNKKENKPEDYHELYKQISFDFREPLLYEHMNVEGTTSFTSVVFIPQEKPFDLYQRDSHGLHLYVKRVSITEKCKELLPEYLRFINGVVETDDIPLNVSREILQQNQKLPWIKKQVVKRVLTSLINLSKNEPEKFKSFYDNFGTVLKEGFHFDHDNHEQLSEIVRFKSSKTGNDSYISLQEYVDRKAENQKEIFYITAPSYEVAERSPHLEAFTSRGIEVLFLVDPIDEWFAMDYTKHKDFELKSILKGEVDLKDLGNEPEKKEEDSLSQEALTPLVEAMKKKLEVDIKDVRISKRLTESACCLVADESGMSSHMERLIQANNKEFKGTKKILEINPNHELIKNLLALKKENKDAEVEEWVETLYDTALLAEGASVRNPGSFAKRITKIMESASRGQ